MDLKRYSLEDMVFSDKGMNSFDFNRRFTVTEFALSFDDRGLAVGETSKSNRISDRKSTRLN
jgi:hypothetical protein